MQKKAKESSLSRMTLDRSSLFATGVVFLLLLVGVTALDERNNGSKYNGGGQNEQQQQQEELGTKTPKKMFSLADVIDRSQKSFQDPERVKASREQWQKALEEIKGLALDSSKSRREGGFFSQWKLLLDEPIKVELDPETNLTSVEVDTEELSSSPSSSEKMKRKRQRFEGFPSWDRILQDWAEDVQDYLDRIEAESTEYPMSTHGRPSSKNPKNGTKSDEPDTAVNGTTSSLKKHGGDDEVPGPQKPKVRSERIRLPVPAPVKDGEPVLPHTDISDKSKNIWIVTTAALPWMTGTAVNPLLRAAYMTEGRSEAGGSVTLMLPWLERQQDQDNVYGKNRHFETPQDQEEYVRTWLRDTAKMPEASEKLNIEWYTAWQNKVENSIYSMGDITALIPAEKVDIMILEEPEHLNWYRGPGESWTDKFKHVVGIIHTNYFVYAQDQPAAFIRAPGMRLLCAWMCRAHCHRVIKLSGTLGQFAPEKELVENVHGVRSGFLETGQEVRRRLEAPCGRKSDPIFGAEAKPTVYFIGKMLWSKGLGSLMELLKYAEESAGIKVHVDMYGGGPDKDAAEAKAQSSEVDMEFHGPIDHGELGFTHKIFINPSTSEVLCTTVAEALAMGKFVIVPSHPSNDFFAQFPNCLTYTNKEEFVGYLYYALTHPPEPLTEADAYALSWRAATERLEAAGCIPFKEAEMMSEALQTNAAGVEITLPPLIEKDEDRRLIASGLRRSRYRFRQFRSRLSQEIEQSTVLPSFVKQRLVSELSKRLDLDFDDALESPKLRLQLSPAELDKRLLELYKSVSSGPGGDVLRVIGGGSDVAFQSFYIKQQAAKQRSKNATVQALSFVPFDTDENDETILTPALWVQRALKRNLPKNNLSITRSNESLQFTTKTTEKEETKPKMKMSLRNFALVSQSNIPTSIKPVHPSQFCPQRKSTTFSLLI